MLVCFLVLLLEGNKELLGKGFNSEEVQKKRKRKKGEKLLFIIRLNKFDLQ